MPTWEGDPRPIEDDPAPQRVRYHGDSPTWVRQTDSYDALGAFAGVTVALVQITYATVMLVVTGIIYLVRRIKK